MDQNYGFIKYKIQKLGEKKYGLRTDIQFKYPFYSFVDDSFSEFMIKIFNCLEYRQFQSDYIIANELDECSEILFVDSG